MKRTAVILAVLAASFIALVLALCWPSGYMITRDIGCSKANSERGKDICDALSASMEWTWMGHAIVSPGWRVTWRGLGRVYCQEKITDDDLPMLEMLKRGSDWRLEFGADSLIRLAINSSGKQTEPETSIFNPNNADYILKNGCVYQKPKPGRNGDGGRPKSSNRLFDLHDTAKTAKTKLSTANIDSVG